MRSAPSNARNKIAAEAQGHKGYEGGAEYAQAQHHAKMIKRGERASVQYTNIADDLNPHHQTPQMKKDRHSQRLQELAEEQAAAKAEADAKAVVKKAVMRKVMARRAAAKAAKKKKKRDRQKRKKRAIEDTDHVEGEDIKFEPAKFLAESRTSSASSSGSSSFESVQEDEDIQFKPAKKQSPDAPLSRQNRVRSEPPDWFQDIQFKPTKKQKTQSVFT